MSSARIVRHVVLLFGAMTAACSALGLGDYEITPCDPREPCDALNQGIDDNECLGYYCRDDGDGCEPQLRDGDRDGAFDRLACEGEVATELLDCDDDQPSRAPMRTDTCDGIDNDCSGYIDESASFDAGESSTLNEPGVARVSHAATPDGTLHLMLDRGASDVARRTISGSEITSSSPAFLSDSRCTPPPGGGVQTCNIDQLALAAARNVVVAAGIHLADCGEGQLRLGAASPSEPIPMGDDPAGRSSFGIDIHPDNPRACSTSTSCDGASDPALALWAVPDRPEASEGILLWRAPDDRACANQHRLAGLAFSIDGVEGPFRGLNVHETNTRLSDAPVLGPPVVAMLGSAGYVAAFPSEDEVVLLLMPPIAGGPSVEVSDSTSVPAEDGSHVALATGSLEGAGVAVAYRGRTEDGDAIVFKSLAVAQSRFDRVEPTRAFPIDGEVIDGPSLAYLPNGLSVDGAQGGFLVLWVERASDARAGDHRLVAGRIAERGWRVLNDRVVLAEGRIHQVFTDSKQQAGGAPPAYGYLTDRAVRLGTVLCEN